MIILGMDEEGATFPFLVDGSGKIIPALYPHSVFDVDGVSQVLKYGEAVNTTSTIYTVTTGKTLYLTSLFAHISNSSAGGNVVDFQIYNDSAVLQMQWRLAAVAGALNVMAIPFSTPVKLLSAWTVALKSPAALVYIRGSFTGYEV